MIMWEFQKFNILIKERLIFGTNISETIAQVVILKYYHGTTRQSILLLRLKINELID